MFVMMQPFRSASMSSYNLKNCFGFDEDEMDISFWNNSSVLNSTMAPLEFQPNKPYRLALYVKPIDRRRVNNTSTFSALRNNKQKSIIKNNKNISAIKLKDKIIVKTPKGAKKAATIMLFDENTTPENTMKPQENTPQKLKFENSSILKSVNSSRKKVLSEVNTKPVAKARQYKIRRSYERKAKNGEPEITIEKPSSEIIKELEIKKLSRTKSKKLTKEEKEFEKWASDINSDFNDVDKFELSITYD